MKLTVNERLRMQLEFTQAQAAQFRVMLGMLVHKLGDTVVIGDSDLAELNNAEALLTFKDLPDEEGQQTHRIKMEVLTGEAAKKYMDENTPRIIAPEPEQESNLIIPGK